MMKFWFICARMALDIAVIMCVGLCALLLLLLAVLAVAAGLRALLW